jgi:hypothetical protein
MFNGLRSCTIYTAVSPLYYACWVLGLAPYSYNGIQKVSELLWTALWVGVYILGIWRHVTYTAASET